MVGRTAWSTFEGARADRRTNRDMLRVESVVESQRRGYCVTFVVPSGGRIGLVDATD